MRVTTSPIGLAFSHGRSGSIVATSAEFDFTIEPTPAPAEPGIKRVALAKSGKRVALTGALEKSGFTALTGQIAIRKISTAPAASAPGKKGGAASAAYPSARIAIDAGEGEHLIALEFHPATGEILDWFVPSEKVVPLPPDTMSLTRKALAPRNNKKSAAAAPVSFVFDIPLTVAYPRRALPKKGAQAKNALTDMFGRVVQIFSIDKVRQVGRKLVGKLLTPLIKPLDKLLVRQERLQHFVPALPTVTAQQKKTMSGKPTLLFVHGIISSTHGAFGEVLDIPGYYQRLQARYGKNMIAWEHWTLSKDTPTNAKELARELPDGAALDIICHSRGAGVVRALLETPQLMTQLDSRGITVNKVCFVAGACEGSDLATEDAVNRIFNVINKMSVLLGYGGVHAQLLTEVIKLILGGLQELPGTDSMDPTGTVITNLSQSAKTLASRYLYVRANFDSANAAAALVDKSLIDRLIFNGKANDVVVPFAGAGKNSNYLANGQVIKQNIHDLGTGASAQSDVWHITFFRNASVRDALGTALGF